jgi:GNAT superfamily N-acetyltransferase
VIRAATKDDLDGVTETLAAAFVDGDFGPWLIPDRRERAAVYQDYFRIFAEFWLCCDAGVVEASDDLRAVALWLRVGQEVELDIPDYDARLAATTGPACPRFQTLDRVMHDSHPVGQPHDYLAFLAVRPGEQCRGLGAALLRHHHGQLDAEGMPAYLEATGPRNSALYARHGYTPRPPLPVGAGGALHPMWRPPT